MNLSGLCLTNQFSLGEQGPFGSSLTVKHGALSGLRGQTVVYRISYTTSPDASALQWLEPR